MRLSLLAALAALAPSLALLCPRGAPLPRAGVVRRGQGFGSEPPKPKRKKAAATGPATIRVDDDGDGDGDGGAAATTRAAAPGGAAAQDSIFEKFGIDSTGAAPRSRIAEAPAEPPFEPLKNVPPDAQIALERVLAGGIGACLLVFLGIGGAITYEAFAATSGTPLDPATQQFIVEKLEPNFTPTLVAGFACSILLGGLKTLQLTSDTGQYSEGAAYSEDD